MERRIYLLLISLLTVSCLMNESNLVDESNTNPVDESTPGSNAPIIINIIGNGSDDEHFKDGLFIEGLHFTEDLEAVLVKEEIIHELTVTSINDSTIYTGFPVGLEEDYYTLKLSNAKGSAEEELYILQGTAGINCWDLDGDGVNDLDEDINKDGSWNASDCKGATGTAGASGATGATGAAGATGTAGAIGATGATGAAGTAGAIGATGAAGAAGTNGTAVYLKSSNCTIGAVLDTNHTYTNQTWTVYNTNDNAISLYDLSTNDMSTDTVIEYATDDCTGTAYFSKPHGSKIGSNYYKADVSFTTITRKAQLYNGTCTNLTDSANQKRYALTQYTPSCTFPATTLSISTTP